MYLSKGVTNPLKVFAGCVHRSTEGMACLVKACGRGPGEEEWWLVVNGCIVL